MLNDEQLQAFLQGSLSPDEAARIASEIEASDELQQRLANLSIDRNIEEFERPVPADRQRADGRLRTEQTNEFKHDWPLQTIKTGR